MKAIIALLILIGVAGVLYNNFDTRLYYFGRNDFSRNDLPLGIRPDYRPPFEGGFGLRDEHGFTIAAKGNTYKNGEANVLVETVISYCWNNDTLIAEIRDIEESRYLVEFSRKSDTENELNVNVFDGNSNLPSQYKQCFDLKDSEAEVDRLMNIRAILKGTLLLLVIGLVSRVVVFLRIK